MSGKAAVCGDAQPSIVCDREERHFGPRVLSAKDVVSAPTHDPCPGGELPVQLGERERAVAEDAGLSRRWQQVRPVGVGRDSIDVPIAELVP
jgi:hypothetical protein